MGVRMMWSEIDFIFTVLAPPVAAYLFWKELTKD